MGRTKNDSRCAKPDQSPYTWHEYVARDGEAVFQNELEEAMESGAKTQREFEVRMGEIRARRDLAGAGGLVDSVHLDPVRRRPKLKLWELRWQFGKRQFRMYHAEPESHPKMLLALKAHWKWVMGTKQQIDIAQDREMDVAGDRYERARPSL